MSDHAWDLSRPFTSCRHFIHANDLTEVIRSRGLGPGPPAAAAPACAGTHSTGEPGVV